jgi:hypothetical protein
MKIEIRGSNRKHDTKITNLQSSLRDFIRHHQIRDILGEYAREQASFPRGVLLKSSADSLERSGEANDPLRLISKAPRRPAAE